MAEVHGGVLRRITLLIRDGLLTLMVALVVVLDMGILPADYLGDITTKDYEKNKSPQEVSVGERDPPICKFDLTGYLIFFSLYSDYQG